MQKREAERVDELCQRHCAFALYASPGETGEHFCMAEDGRTEPDFRCNRGFLSATFTGERLFIPAELKEPPTPNNWKKMRKHPHTPATTRQQYAALFRLYTEFIRRGQIHKIVLARTEDYPVAPTFSPYTAFRKACEQHPSAFKALVHTPQHGTWLFCTPEQLITGKGETWHTMALAGTRPPSTQTWDSKNTREQALVTEFMREVLTPLADSISISAPETLRAGNVEHICSRFLLRMPSERLSSVLEQLPPTPAVCGFPVPTARKLLLSTPDIDRSCYAGYLGMRDTDSVQLYVALRCMQIFPEYCRLYAGGGLMPDSEEESEWQETVAKMRTMRDILSE